MIQTNKTGSFFAWFCLVMYMFSGSDVLDVVANFIFGDNPVKQELMNTLFYLILFKGFVMAYRKSFGKCFLDFKKNIKKNVKYMVLTFLFIIAAMFVSAIIMSILGIELSSNEKALEEATKNSFIITYISTVILGPFSEEMIFRLHLNNFLEGKIGKNAAVLVGAIIFALFHTTIGQIIGLDFKDIFAQLPLFFAGIGFIVLKNKTNNIFCPVIVHMLNNALAFVL